MIQLIHLSSNSLKHLGLYHGGSTRLNQCGIHFIRSCEFSTGNSTAGFGYITFPFQLIGIFDDRLSSAPIYTKWGKNCSRLRRFIAGKVFGIVQFA
jgi:hypothetical protein